MSGVEIPCRFCGRAPSIARHEIDRYDVAPWEDEPVKWWYACADCHALIMADDASTVNGRVASLNPAMKDLDLIDAVNAAVAFTEPFWKLQSRVYETLPIW